MILVSYWTILFKNCNQVEVNPGSLDGRNVPSSTVEAERRPRLWPKTRKYQYQVNLEKKYLPSGFLDRCKHLEEAYQIWGLWHLVKSPGYLERVQSLQNALPPFQKFTATLLKPPSVWSPSTSISPSYGTALKGGRAQLSIWVLSDQAHLPV